MQKISFIFLIFTLPLISNSQILKYRGYEYCKSKITDTECIFLPTDFLITLSSKKVKIYGENVIEIDLIEKVKSFEDEKYLKAEVYKCVDEDGFDAIFQLIIYRVKVDDALGLLNIIYDNFKLSYRIKMND